MNDQDDLINNEAMKLAVRLQRRLSEVYGVSNELGLGVALDRSKYRLPRFLAKKLGKVKRMRNEAKNNLEHEVIKDFKNYQKFCEEILVGLDGIERLHREDPLPLTLTNVSCGLALRTDDHASQVFCGLETSQDRHKWTFRQTGPEKVAIASRDSMRVLQAVDEGGWKLALQSYFLLEGQLWRLERLDDDSHMIVSAASGLALDAYEAGDRWNVHLYEVHGKENQRWWIRPSFAAPPSK